jgi:hypothetical protein
MDWKRQLVDTVIVLGSQAIFFAYMNWLERLIPLSKRTRHTVDKGLTVAGLLLTFFGAANFVLANKLYSIEKLQQIFLFAGNRFEMQRILKKLAINNKADRAFFMYYNQLKDGRFVSVFKEYYQWQSEGQPFILEESYLVTPGADTVRRKVTTEYHCNEVLVDKLPPEDELAIALKKSNVRAQVSCPVIDVFVDGQKRLGVLSLEFADKTYDRTKVEASLWERSADVIKSFD